MSFKYGPSQVSGAFRYGSGGLGPRGWMIPAEGLNGAGALFACLAMPADADKEVRMRVTRQPAGTLLIDEDSSFTYTGPTDYALFELWVDGYLSTIDIGFGLGIGRLDLTVGGSAALVGVNSTQQNTSSSGSVTQAHALVGSDSTQANLSLAGTVYQTHQLVGTNSTQVNLSATVTLAAPGDFDLVPSRTYYVLGENRTVVVRD